MDARAGAAADHRRGYGVRGVATPPVEAARPESERAEPEDRRARWLLDPVLLGCFALLLAFPLVATAAAARQPIVTSPDEPPAPAAEATGPTLRDVPAFTPGGEAARAVADERLLTERAALEAALARAMDALLRGRDRAPLEALVTDSGAAVSFVEPEYPFRFPRVEAVLDRAMPPELDDERVAAANDLGALLVLAAARFAELSPAAPLAFAILDRARADGACLPQLNLAFLLSTHERPRDDVTAAELTRAARTCRDDPTPLWLLGQFQSQRERLRPALASFRRLQRRLPDSSAGWAGEADAWVRATDAIDGDRPFTARSRYRRALSLYREAAARDPDPGLDAGKARAFAGLRLYGEAVQAERRALARRRADAPLRARLVEYLERDRRFAAAAAAAAAVLAEPRFPKGPALFMRVDAEAEPASLGSGRLLPVSLDVAPVTSGGGAVGNVVDLSFIPEFREVVGLTGYHRWCPAWSQRRDLVLARRPREALASMPERFGDVRPRSAGDDCPDDASLVVPLVAGVALVEAGDPDAAVERLQSAGYETEGRRPLALLHDARQNLWRFAGDLDRAAAAASAWTRVAPTSALAFDRAGEVAFLDEDYGRAARLFGVSVRLARSSSDTWSLREAEGLLKRGTALEFAGRYGEALAVLDDADEVASRVYAAASREDDDFTAVDAAAYASYNARLQAADTHLRARRYSAALDQYDAARERERDLGAIGPGAPLRRPEVLDNNQALVQVLLGNPGGALEAARRALRSDPLNPIFLQNLGFTLDRLGRRREAIDAYRAAVVSDPTLFPAWNDLGIALAREGDLRAATRAFRRAVGVLDDYGLGWFNLGVALERRGLLHAPAAQGAFGRAFRLEPGLRDRARRFVPDETPYLTTLDLSKPLPPKWEFARTQERAPVAVAGVAFALLLGLQLGRTAAGPGLGGDARRWLELTRDFLARLPRALVSTTAILAVAATLAVFLIPLLRSRDTSLTSALLLVTGVALLIALVMRARVLAARQAGVALRQRGWPPGMLVGLGASLFGLPWAPLPVAETDRPAPAVHWIGPIVIAAAALCLLSLGVGLEIPATRALGAAALVMTASLLTPIEPLDGGHVARGAGGIVAGLALVAAGLFFLLGLS